MIFLNTNPDENLYRVAVQSGEFITIHTVFAGCHQEIRDCLDCPNGSFTVISIKLLEGGEGREQD